MRCACASAEAVRTGTTLRQLCGWIDGTARQQWRIGHWVLAAPDMSDSDKLAMIRCKTSFSREQTQYAKHYYSVPAAVVALADRKERVVLRRVRLGLESRVAASVELKEDLGAVVRALV